MGTKNYVVQGFKASAISAGLKKDGTLDLALITSEVESTAAGVFTTSKVRAAPVILSHDHIKGGKARGVIANAGQRKRLHRRCRAEGRPSDSRSCGRGIGGPFQKKFWWHQPVLSANPSIWR